MSTRRRSSFAVYRPSSALLMITVPTFAHCSFATKRAKIHVAVALGTTFTLCPGLSLIFNGLDLAGEDIWTTVPECILDDIDMLYGYFCLDLAFALLL